MQLRPRIAALIDAYPRMLWLLAFGSFLNIGGLSFLWPLTTIYMHEHLGQPLTMAGLVLLVHSGAAALGQLAGGWLYDRIGARPVMLTGLFASASLTALLGFFDAFPIYVAVMIAFGFSASLVFPSINALVARAWPGGGRRAFNFVYVANNVGVAFGTALGGLIAGRSFALAFLSASAVFALFALFVLFAIRDPRAMEGTPSAGVTAELAAAREGREAPVPWLPIIALFIAFLTLWLIYVQWQASVSVYMKASGYELAAYSVLWTMNGVLIVAAQPLLSLVVRYLRRSSAQMLLGTALYAAAFGVLLTSTSYWVFVASMVILTFGEMLLWPTMPAAVARLSPPSMRGRLQGFILSGATFGRMLGPLVGGLLYDNAGFAILLVVMVAGLSIPLAAIALYGRTQPVEEPSF
ncbi:MAG: MDR family MFS transporter [Bacillota bacterium]